MSLFGKIRSALIPAGSTPAPRRGRSSTSRPRRFLVLKRGYGGGTQDRLSNTFASTPRTFDSHVYESHKSLVARCREAARDAGMVKRFLGILVNNVVGDAGIILQSQPLDELGQLDKRAAEAIEAAWADWSRPATCDIRQRLNFPAIQRLVQRILARDGEAVIEEVLGDQAGPYGYALNLLDPQLLDLELNQVNSNGNRIVMGVEIDAYSRPVAYHIIDPITSGIADPRNGGYYHSGRLHRRIPADRLIHIFAPEDAAQTRGVPWPSAALADLQQLDAGLEAATFSFRLGALQVAFIETPDGEDPGVSEVDDDGNLLDDIEPGSIGRLREGEKLHKFDPNYPDSQLGPFVECIKRDVASSLETSYSSLASDYKGVSFSAGRLDRLNDTDFWRTCQAFLSLSFNQRVFEGWLRMAITAQKITVPARGGGGPKPLDIRRLEKYRRARWQGRGWDSVDELKTTMAARERVAMGSSTVSWEIRKLGRDPDEVFEERAKEIETLKKLNIVPPEPALDAAQAALQEDEKHGPEA